jgi:two-component sensor histidine kinase
MPGNQSAATNSAADEQLLLVEEMQHRVANEYAILVSSLHLRAQGCADPIRTFLEETSERLNAFASVHRALLPPRSAITVDLGEYLQKLCLALTRASLAERRLSLLLREAPVPVEAHRAWRVGLIVSELITNAVRHGAWQCDGGVIEVEVLSDPVNVQCRVSDNGGRTNGLSRGRGTEIIVALAQELGGHIHRELNDKGVTVLLTFPCWSKTDAST